MSDSERIFLIVCFAGFVAWLALRTTPVPPLPLPAPPLPPSGLIGCPPAGTRVLLIGDSLAVGMDGPMQQLAATCSRAFLAQAKIGTSVTQWAKESWIGPALDLGKPTVVIISLGANDFGRNDPENVRASTLALVARIRAYGARVLWLSPPVMPFPDKVGATVFWKEAVGEDWFPGELLALPRAPDNIHPTPAGYKTLAEKVWTWMASKVSP